MGCGGGRSISKMEHGAVIRDKQMVCLEKEER